MKKLTDYIQESQQWMESPGEGDTFGIELEDDTLLETYVMEVADDGSVLLDSTPEIYSLLESWNMLSEDIDTDVEEDIDADRIAKGHSRRSTNDLEEMAPLAAVAGGALARAAAKDVAGKIGDALDGEEPVNEFDTDVRPDPGEYDTEGDMAKNELHTIIRAARKLTGMLDNDDNMPEWTQKKINKAADYVDTAADYISSQKERGVMEQNVAEDFDVEAAREQLASLQRELKAVTGNYPGDDRNRTILRSQILGLKEKIKAAGGKKSGVSEGSEDVSPVARAVLHRIMMAHPGVLAQHGPERVMSAVDELADWVNIGPDDEIGSSDVSGWTRDVIRMLAELPDEAMSDVDRLEEGPVSGEIDDSWMNDKHKEFYKRNPHFKRNNRDRVEVGSGTQLATRVDPSVKPAQVRKKPAAGFGMSEAEYQGRDVPLGKPMRGDVAKFKVYVRDPKTGNVKKVNFGDPNMRIKKSNPARRKSFRARHNCDNPGPRTKARYWACRAW